MGSSTISLGLGLGGGKSATSSGTSGGGGGGAFTNQYSVSLDGTDDYIDIPDSTSLELSTFSWSAWIKIDTLNQYNMIVDTNSQSGGNGLGYTLFVENSNNKISFWSYNASDKITSTTVISANTWYHVAATHTSGSDKLYINGTLEASGSASNFQVSDASYLRFGSSQVFGLFYEGLLDEISFFNTELSASDISALRGGVAAGTLGSPADITSLNPVGWWRMGDNDGGTGTTITNQGSASSIDGTLTNGPTFSTEVPLRLPSITNTLSASFDGSDDYLLMGTSAISLDTNFTIAAWFRPTSYALAGYDFICGWGNAASGQARVMQILNSKLSFEIYFSRISGATTLSADTWYHGAVTFSGNNVEIFLNGSSDGTGTLSRSSMASSLTFAGGTAPMSSVGFAPFSGLIDEFAVFDSVLSSSEISAIYNSGVPADISTLNPVGWWRMGDGSGDTDSGGGTPANTDTIGTVVNQGSASNANGAGTNGPTFSTTIPS